MNDPDLPVTRCGELLHRILLDIRQLCWNNEPDEIKWIEDLADISHNLPRYMNGTDDYAIQGLRECFIHHVKKRWPNTIPEQSIYVRLFDMTDEEFEQAYARYQSKKPEYAVN